MVAERITPTKIKLYVVEDIEFMTPQEFDGPTPEQLERERKLAKAMALWADEYEDRMYEARNLWLVEEWEL
jgi:hypothetical protein